MGRRQRGTRHAADRLTWQERHTLSLGSLERQRLLTEHRDLAADAAASARII